MHDSKNAHVCIGAPKDPTAPTTPRRQNAFACPEQIPRSESKLVCCFDGRETTARCSWKVHLTAKWTGSVWKSWLWLWLYWPDSLQQPFQYLVMFKKVYRTSLWDTTELGKILKWVNEKKNLYLFAGTLNPDDCNLNLKMHLIYWKLFFHSVLRCLFEIFIFYFYGILIMIRYTMILVCQILHEDINSNITIILLIFLLSLVFSRYINVYMHINIFGNLTY